MTIKFIQYVGGPNDGWTQIVAFPFELDSIHFMPSYQGKQPNDLHVSYRPRAMSANTLELVEQHLQTFND